MKPPQKFFLAIFIALILNIIWEFSHYRLFIDLSGIPLIPHLLLASFTDMIIIFGIFLIISLKNKTLNWINKPSKTDYSLIIIFSIVIAITIELINLNLGRWQYTSAMPTIFTIGLSPLVQLFTTGILALWVVRWMKK